MQKVGIMEWVSDPSLHHSTTPSSQGVLIRPLGRLIFKPKADLNGDLEFLAFVFFNQPAHFRHFEPVYMA